MRTLKEFREAFALEQALAYFLDGKLLVWLEDRFYEEEAEKVSALENTDPELPRKLCDIFGVEYREGMLDKKEEEEVDSSFEDDSLAQNDEAKGISYIRKLSEREYADFKQNVVSYIQKSVAPVEIPEVSYSNLLLLEKMRIVTNSGFITMKYSLNCPINYVKIADAVAKYELSINTSSADLETIRSKIDTTIILNEFADGTLPSYILDRIYLSTDYINTDILVDHVMNYFNDNNLNVDSYRAELKNQVSCLFEQINRLIESGAIEYDGEKISCIGQLSEREFNDVKEKVLVSLKNSAEFELKLDDYVTQIDREVAIYSAKGVIQRCNIYSQYEKCPKYYKDLVTSVAIKLVAPDMDDDICRWGWVAYDRYAARVNVDKIQAAAVSAIIKTECMNGTLVSYILDRLYQTLDSINVDLLVDYSLDYFKEQQLNVEAYRAELKNQMICLFEQISNSLIKRI